MPSLSGGTDARGADDVEPEVALLADGGLTGMEPHADTDTLAVRPRVLFVPALRLDGSHGRVARTSEREEERVTLCVDLDAAVGAERLAHDPPVVGNQGGVGVPEPLEQLRRALDVAEHERDRSGGERHDDIQAAVLPRYMPMSPTARMLPSGSLNQTPLKPSLTWTSPSRVVSGRSS